MAFLKGPILALRLELFLRKAFPQEGPCAVAFGAVVGLSCVLLMNSGERLDGTMASVALHRVTDHTAVLSPHHGKAFSFHVSGSAGGIVFLHG